MIIPFEPPGRARQPGCNMADEHHERLLDALLSHDDPLPDDDFVLRVMQRTRLERRRRLSILLGFGLLGGAFGVLGALQLAQPISMLFAGLTPTSLMQVVLLTCGGAAFYAWFMNEDLGLAA